MERSRGSQEVEGGTAVLHSGSVDSTSSRTPKTGSDNESGCWTSRRRTTSNRKHTTSSNSGGWVVVVIHKNKAGYQFRRQPIGKTGEQAAQMGGENRTTGVWVPEGNRNAISQLWGLHEWRSWSRRWSTISPGDATSWNVLGHFICPCGRKITAGYPRFLWWRVGSMGSQPSSVRGVEHRRRGTDVLFGVHGHGRLFGVSHRGRGRTKNRAEDHLRRQHGCDSHLGKSWRSVEDSALAVASNSPIGNG